MKHRLSADQETAERLARSSGASKDSDKTIKDKNITGPVLADLIAVVRRRAITSQSVVFLSLIFLSINRSKQKEQKRMSTLCFLRYLRWTAWQPLQRAPDGVVYVGFQCGLLALKGTQLNRFFVGPAYFQPTHLAVDSTRTVWFTDPNFGLGRFVNGEVTWFSGKHPLRSHAVQAIEPLRRGVRVFAISNSLVDPATTAFEFDGTRVVEVPPPRPVLGVHGHDDPRGCAVDTVFPRSAAARARIAVRDVISEFDGRKIAGIADLADAVRQYEPGERVTVGIVRNNQPRKVKIALKQRL